LCSRASRSSWPGPRPPRPPARGLGLRHGRRQPGRRARARLAGRVRRRPGQGSPDANDDCFVGGVKELTPNQWAFNRTAGGCTPGKSNLRVAYAHPESTASTTFGHFAFFRNDTTGNSFLTFELNQAAGSWTNATGTTIPCRSDGDVLLSYEVGGSSLTTVLYKWQGDGTGPAECRDGASGTFISSGPIPSSRYQATMNAATAIANRVNPARYGATFPANSFGEGAVDLPAVLTAMGQGPCFGFLQMQVHSRSSSSISSAMIDYTTPVPVHLQSCAATGTAYQDTNGNGVRDGGETGLAGAEFYADLDLDGVFDAGEPSGTSDASGFYKILKVPAGTFDIREVRRAAWSCGSPVPCSYRRSLPAGGNTDGNDFAYAGPSTASGVKFHDLDADGVRDPGEPGLAGWQFFVDGDASGTLDAGEPSAVSDATGAWTIGDIRAGAGVVREVAQPGWTCSAPDPCAVAVTFESNSSRSGLEFGGWAPATAGGRLFEDLDGDGVEQEPGEPALQGWTVYADANGNGALDLLERSAVTNLAGDYTIAGLRPGAHLIRAVTPSAAWYCTRPAAPCSRPLTLTSGELASGQGFGFTRFATVSGSKFDDVTNLGVKDASEGPLAGFTFFADYDGNAVLDAGEPSAVSDAAGVWSIAGVRAGASTLREQPNGAYVCTRPNPCSVALSLASGAVSSGHVFGNNVDRSVSGVVFNDGDADGLAREAGETGVAGWTAFADKTQGVQGVLDAGEQFTVTNSQGEYRLTGLANGKLHDPPRSPVRLDLLVPGAGALQAHRLDRIRAVRHGQGLRRLGSLADPRHGLRGRGRGRRRPRAGRGGARGRGRLRRRQRQLGEGRQRGLGHDGYRRRLHDHRARARVVHDPPGGRRRVDLLAAGPPAPTRSHSPAATPRAATSAPTPEDRSRAPCSRTPTTTAPLASRGRPR
jgi:hypothetical protein